MSQHGGEVLIQQNIGAVGKKAERTLSCGAGQEAVAMETLLGKQLSHEQCPLQQVSVPEDPHHGVSERGAYSVKKMELRLTLLP